MTVDRSLVVITQFLPDFDGFESWLRAKASGPGTPPAPPPDQPQESHGEFTRLFRAAGEPPAPPRGDFTSPGAGSAPPPAPTPVPGQFTDLFRAAAGPPPPIQRPDPDTIPPVRMVGVRVPPPSEPASPESGPPRLTPNFGPSRDPAARPETAAGWPQPGEVVIRNEEPAAAPLPPPSWDGPSEFTRLLGSVSPPTGELAQTATLSPPQEDPAERKRSYLPLFVVLNLVFVLATGLVVYFALRRC
jgi:hypothetical protein